jgi:hypothetical protein
VSAIDLRPEALNWVHQPLRRGGDSSDLIHRETQGGSPFRLGFLRGNTELPGRLSAAVDTFVRLTGRAPNGAFDQEVLPQLRVVFRELGSSGHPKIDVIDYAQKFLEHITFK